jgi:cupin 2 domain-containing protein
MAKRLTDFPEVEKIALFGSLAKPPYRKWLPTRKRIWTFHQPSDIDLAIWLSSLEQLAAMRQTLAKLVGEIAQKVPGLCNDRIELFVFDSKSSKFLGWVCHYHQCPRQGMECMVEGCGKPKHLKQMGGFKLTPDAVSRIHSQLLFERHPTVECSHLNLLADLPNSLPEELIEKLVATKHVRIERIISTGHTSPPGYWYDQKEHEWVIVLQGHAILEIENETRSLNPGDCVLIPAHQKHRVSATSPTEPTVWLAVFFSGVKIT